MQSTVSEVVLLDSLKVSLGSLFVSLQSYEVYRPIRHTDKQQLIGRLLTHFVSFIHVVRLLMRV